MKNILIALDYGPSAITVAEKGYKLASAMSASIILLHVVGDAHYYSTVNYSPIMGFNGYMDIEPASEDIVENLKASSMDFLEKTKSHFGNNSIKTLVKEGNVADSILDAVKEMQADMIVIGSHSRNWVEDMLIGNVTEKVLRHSTVPLFIVPVKN